MMSRLLRGVGANLFAQGVTAGVQLFSVPVLVHVWGTDRLGLWLTVAAWSSLLSLADCGLMAAAGNAMAMAAARGDRRAAARVFGALVRFVLAMAAILGALTLIAAWAAPDALVAVADAPASQVRTAASALALAALAGLPLGTVELGFRADRRYAAGVIATGCVRLCEAAAALLVAISGRGLGEAAIVLLAVRIGGTVCAAAMLGSRAPWLGVSLDSRGLAALRPLVRPALAVLAIPAGFALSLQGTTIAAGLVLPAGTVAAFVAARTLTRAIVQSLGLLTHAVMPELSAAAGRGDAGRAAALLRFNFGAALCCLIPGWLALLVCGPRLMAWWTGGALTADPVLFGLLATAALLHGGWMSASNLLLALNRHGEYAYVFAAVAGAGAVLAAALGRVAGSYGVASACVAGEAVMAALVLPGQLRAAFGSPYRLRSPEGAR